MFRVGIDTGGTYTDVVMANIDTGEVFSGKTPTTPKRLVEGIENGIEGIVAATGTSFDGIEELIYGTTIVVNMIAQKQAEATALITTKGFRDVLEIGRAFRQTDIYDIHMDKVEPLVKRDLRFEVTERIDFRGEIIAPLMEDEIGPIVHEMKMKGIRSVAICLLHSYANPIHEKRIKEIIQREWPAVYVSTSSDVNPQFREYERTSTTVINAYMMPNMASHLEEFEAEMRKRGLRSELYIMQGNAGVTTFRSAVDKPVYVSDSGPIAGIIAANHIAGLCGVRNIITLDMGGTSCDVSLIQDNTLKFTTNSHIEGYPISIPTVDLNFIGAGGGSIAWHDAGGALKVGPMSAGAVPGAVCYGRGGTLPTVTDANLMVGRLMPELFLERLTDEIKAKTRRAISEKIADPLHMDIMEAAEGIIEVVNSNMIRAIKLVSVERGYDPREFTLIAFGGAGPLHAGKLAEEMEIPRVVVPYSPGTLCALGLALADIRQDFVCTRLQTEEQIEADTLNGVYEDLEFKGIDALEKEGVRPEDRLLVRTCDIRYFGQAYELNIPVAPGNLTEDDVELMKDRFHGAHERTYGHAMREDPIEFVNYRVSAIGRTKKPVLNARKAWKTGAPAIEKRMGKAVFGRKEYDTPVIGRETLEPGVSIEGPAIIGEMGATIVVRPGHHATVDDMGNVVMYTGCTSSNGKGSI